MRNGASSHEGRRRACAPLRHFARVIGAAALALTGCGAPHDAALQVSPPSSLPLVATTTLTPLEVSTSPPVRSSAQPRPSPPTASVPRTTAETRRPTYLLDQSIALPELGGDQAGCASVPFASRGPALAFVDTWGEVTSRLRVGDPYALCIVGFSTTEAVTVAVDTAAGTVTTSLVPSAGTWPWLGFSGCLGSCQARSSRELLFGRSMSAPLYLTTEPDDAGNPPPPGRQTTGYFRLLPDASDALVAVPSVRITVRQGRRSATSLIEVRPADQPWAFWLDHSDLSMPLLVVAGFAAGHDVPVGLYRRVPGDIDLRARLVGQIGTVHMPYSQVALLRFGSDALRALPRGAFILGVPSMARAGEYPVIVDNAPGNSGDLPA